MAYGNDFALSRGLSESYSLTLLLSQDEFKNRSRGGDEADLALDLKAASSRHGYCVFSYS